MSKDKTKVYWTPSLRTQLISTMIDEQGSGSFSDSGFKSVQWSSIMAKFFEKSGCCYDKQQLQNQHAELKKKFSIFTALKENSGFGWNEETSLPTAPPEVWEEYLAAHPNAKVYRTSTLANFEELQTLFSGKVATGSNARSASTAAAVYSTKMRSTSPLLLSLRTPSSSDPFLQVVPCTSIWG